MEKGAYEVIDLSGNIDQLRLLKYKLSELPHVIILPKLPLEEAQQLVDQLSQFFLERNLNALSPYPTYLVTEAPVHSPIIPLLSRVELFPQHFLRSKGERIQGKENLTQKKMQIQKEKLKNLNPNAHLLEIAGPSSSSKELLALSRLYQFYSEVYRDIRE